MLIQSYIPTWRCIGNTCAWQDVVPTKFQMLLQFLDKNGSGVGVLAIFSIVVLCITVCVVHENHVSVKKKALELEAEKEERAEARASQPVYASKRKYRVIRLSDNAELFSIEAYDCGHIIKKGAGGKCYLNFLGETIDSTLDRQTIALFPWTVENEKVVSEEIE